MDLKKLKALLGLSEDDTSRDAALLFIMEDVEETIQNYCHMKELPEGLKNTAYRMAIDLYRHDQPGAGSAPIRVSSMSEGDTSTSFASMADVLEGGILKDYRGQLNRYRKVRW